MSHLTNMNNSSASNSSGSGANPGANPRDSSSAVVNHGQGATNLGGVVVGIAQRPVIHCTEEGFNGLLSDFVSGKSIKKQISNIKERRAGST
ncbi:hypothetical protein BOTCAL_0236g00030 [Botryotinia calthae]|uniref:Uncharacterized protein n=1 Tax=Botryotinia calthae TaxID=38488 RepID=A0A4Y8CZK9_9HELO|nr:hypothetical protein BOTCAL_0236g00030 [Botryotinia calthae]